MFENDTTLMDIYTLQSMRKSADGYACVVNLNAGHPVYEGHFPGFPVTPGVVMMQVIRECVAHTTGVPLRYKQVNACKFLAVVNPGETPTLELTFSVTGDYRLQASLSCGGQVVLKLKATLTPEL